MRFEIWDLGFVIRDVGSFAICDSGSIDQSQFSNLKSHISSLIPSYPAARFPELLVS